MSKGEGYHTCEYCKNSYRASLFQRHVRSCVHNPKVKATVKMLMQTEPGIACGNQEYKRRCVGIVGATSPQNIMDQLGTNRWADVAQHFGLVFIPVPWTKGKSTATQEWKKLDQTTPEPSGNGWLEATDYDDLSLVFKETRTRTYIMPNGYGLRIVSDIYEVR